MRKIIIISIIVIFLVLGGLGFWYWNQNPYSKEILKVEILGPAEADFAEEIEYTVKYKNNGNVRLEEPRLIFEYPENTIAGGTFIRRREIGPEELGDIYPGDEKTYAFKGRLFGKEGDLKTAKAWISYQPKNLSARYESKTSFTTKIKTIALTFDFDLPSRIEANKDFEFSINYYSILDYPLSDLTVKADYPDGFEFIRSDPDSLSKNEWDIAILNKAEGGRVDIKGKIAAELGEHKVFKASLGFWRDGEFILLKEITKGVEITEPSISIFQEINNQTDYTASLGNMLHYEVYFRNIGEEPFKNLFLVVRLDGAGFDFDSIKAPSGQFEPGDNTIVWDGKNISKLNFLEQGEEGKIEFWVELKDDWAISNSAQKNAFIKNTVLISKMKEEFETKVNSKLVLEQKTLASRELEAGKETIYTINWQAKNYLNDVKNVKVRAVLPPNVRLTGEISPEEQSSNFTFDSQSREIVWMVGDMEAGKGVISDSPVISFEIAVIPSPAQKGSKAVLIESGKITGEDIWTARFIENIFGSLETQESIK